MADVKPVRYARNAAVLVGVALLSAYFMADAYRRARNDAINQLGAQEQILAHQAAKGIAEYFDHFKQTLTFLCREPEVAQNTELGRRLLREFYLSQTNNLLSITRVGADGRILYTFPQEQSIGQDISDQEHIKKIFETHEPVVSEVFMSVQGFQCVALHMPVFENDRFVGTLAVLFPFDVISQRFVEDIQIGESGYAILLSRAGIELYCPLPGHVRQSIYDTAKDSPSVQTMAHRMLSGETGDCVYDFDQTGTRNAVPIRKRAFFLPVKLENTFWSICVTAPEAEALAFIQGFRNRWIVGVGLLLVTFGVWGLFLGRAFLTIHQERTRRAAEARLQQAEREHARALAESEERFRTYFEDSLLAMTISSPQKGLLAVNKRMIQLLGYSKEELTALTWPQLTHPDDVAVDLAQFERMLAGEVEGYSMEKRFLRKDQSVVHVILSTRLIRRTDGTPDYCVVQLQDITDRKRAEAERIRLEENLRQAQKLEAVGQLAGGVAHDYNNLLTVQLGHLGLLQQTDGLPAEVRESLIEIERSAKMAAQLTRQLLAFSRRQMLQITRLDLNEVLDHLLKMLRRVLREDISLELKMAREPLWLDADAGMMEQVVMNLVVNARDAMPTGGRLTLATEAVEFTTGALPATSEARPGKFICLVVADTGLGMNEETCRRIFEPFFTTKEVGKGTGLGLATVYGIVKQHNGWIEVESAEKRGTVFRVFYQAASTPGSGSESTSGDTESTSLLGDGQTILLAEDDPAVRHTLLTSLQRLNYRVLPAANSLEAEQSWQAYRSEISLLLTDMVMAQGDNGLQLATRLRAESPDLKVIIMSGYSEDLVASGLSANMVFLPKPCSTETLARTLRQTLKP